MKIASCFFALLTLTSLSCSSDEDKPLRGTILKEIKVNMEAVSMGDTYHLFLYDELNQLVRIENNNSDFFSIDIQYQNGKVSKYNEDSLVYEDGMLVKTVLADDPDVVTAEFKFENNKLTEKSIYYSTSIIIGGGPVDRDTLQLKFSYDAAGNIIKTESAQTHYSLVNPVSFNAIDDPGEIEYDSKVSPFIDLPLELKCILMVNPGPNNIIRRTFDVFPGATPSTMDLHYNQDDRPVAMKGVITTKLTYY